MHLNENVTKLISNKDGFRNKKMCGKMQKFQTVPVLLSINGLTPKHLYEVLDIFHTQQSTKEAALKFSTLENK
jgi:hypothetical protein